MPNGFPRVPSTVPPVGNTSVGQVATNFPESFDNASKRTYEGAAITTNSGIWYLDNAVVGSSENDQKSGEKSIRVKENGSVTMSFDIPTGIAQIKLKYGAYQTDGQSSFEVAVSTNGGNTWQNVGSPIAVTQKSLVEATFQVNIQSPCRLRIRKTDGTANRLNLDDIVVNTYTNSSLPNNNSNNTNASLPTRDNNLTLGNLSNANSNDRNNFLMEKPTFSLSYNESKGTANWVAWHLSTAWKGTESRQNDFRPDPQLPQGWFSSRPADYRDTGFDRGHLCPSDDRDADLEDNQSTFLMTNMTPQAPKHNRGIWKNLEEYARKLTQAGNEVYIMAGPIGKGGTGENGLTKTLADGKITVPASLWKVIVVLPIGQNDLSRIDAQTRIIVVNIPNKDSVGADNWGDYRISLSELEEKTGLNFLESLPNNIKKSLKDKVDSGGTR